MEFEEYSDEELLEAGREAVKREQWVRALQILSPYVARFNARGETVPASGLASYALSLGHNKEVRRGLELCKRAQNADPRNPHIYWCLSQLHLLAGSRKDAIESVDRGLRAVPDNFRSPAAAQAARRPPASARFRSCTVSTESTSVSDVSCIG